MAAELPAFRYHPDPLVTGSVERSDAVCEACGEARGYVYSGPVYCPDEVEAVCPWCISDGRAAAEFDATFTTVDGAPEGVPSAVFSEIEERTPGFAGWQQERWLFHCNDGAEYLGRVGWDQIESHESAVALLIADGWPEDVLPQISRDGDLTGYLFRCRHCGTLIAYADAS